MGSTLSDLGSKFKQLISRSPQLSETCIVCVDDEESLLETIADYLTPLGLKIERFISPDAAQAFVQKHHRKVTLIVSDYKMPGMNGLELRSAILESDPKIPYVILSGFIDTAMALKALEYRVAAFIPKPLVEDEMIRVLENAVLERLTQIVDDQELLDGFVLDASALLDQLEESALALGESPEDLEVFNGIFGIIHTLKGASSFFEPKTMHHFVHKFEDYLKPIQNGQAPVTPHVVTALLQAKDLMRGWVEEFRTGEFGAATDADTLVSKITASQGSASTPEGEPSAAAPSNGVAAASKEKPKDLRVELTMLDSFLSAAGEMTVIRNMLNKAAIAIEKRYPSDHDVQNLSELLEELQKINSSVQNRVMEIRKVSMRQILKPVPRVLRDVGLTLGKTVALSIKGQDVRVDTTIAEALNNSLLHLVKNSLDHGIESPEERSAVGKSPEGRLEISTRVDGDNIVIDITDDGRGIDPQRVRNKLKKDGHSDADLARMSDKEVQMMIFAPGFSTAGQVTDISGRGVGMSMVKESVERLGGKVSLESVIGKGTRFTLEMPVPKSVLIKNCLFVSWAGRDYGVARDQIVRVYNGVEGDPSVLQIEKRRVLRMEGQLVPLVSLGHLLAHGTPAAEGRLSSVIPAEFTAVIVRTTAGRPYGIVVDAVKDFEDTVVKPVCKSIQKLDLYSGATFLSDRTVGLLLDVDGMGRALRFNDVEVSGGLTEIAKIEGTSQTTSGSPLKLLEKSYLVFDMDHEGRYAIPQEDIFRIERFSPDQVQMVGRDWNVIYRGQALPLWGTHAGRGGSGGIDTLVVRKAAGGLAGIVVSSIRDIISTHADVELRPSEGGVKGVLVYGDQCLNVMDVAGFEQSQFRAQETIDQNAA